MNRCVIVVLLGREHLARRRAVARSAGRLRLESACRMGSAWVTSSLILRGWVFSPRSSKIRRTPFGKCTERFSSFRRLAAAEPKISPSRLITARMAAASRISFLVACKRPAARVASVLAAASALARTSLSGSAAFAMPIVAAVLPSTGSPRANIANARAWPMRAGSSQLEAASGTSARLTKGVVSFASSAMKTRSQCISIVTPMPTASPCTAATYGFWARASASGTLRLHFAASQRSGRDGGEITEVVAGSEGIAFGLEQHDANRRIAFGPCQRLAERAYIAFVMRVLLLGRLNASASRHLRHEANVVGHAATPK